ncbi:hypothetical protein Syun_003844 [Stephania yunnanensis]|uniref:Calcineurin-like phosphoesterase domain-containing protein n=1 Tax=Stephania yunnanensis TaxID=152371 RepID=A0AAP0L1W2_9MAGN
MVTWKSIVPLLFLAALVIFEERVSVPSCVIVPRDDDVEESGIESKELKVMMVSNLLLMGSEARYLNVYFRDSYTTKFFRHVGSRFRSMNRFKRRKFEHSGKEESSFKSFERLKPDMLVVLGDISARGSEFTSGKWLSVLQQFQRILGPFLGLPLHVILGDRDIGECSKLNARSVEWITRNLPGLDSSGSGTFEMSNISFVSLNAVAMLCGNNDLRFSIEKLIERESLDLQAYTKEKEGKVVHDTVGDNNFLNFKWRENLMQSGSGPVLLLHFPLHRTRSSKCGKDVPKGSLFPSPHGHPKIQDNRGHAGPGPYELFQTLPPNATEYIFQALKPSGSEIYRGTNREGKELTWIVFSAHSHEFCDHIHRDGIREVTVPAMTWDARDDPGFIVASFARNRAVTVSQCSLARESRVLMAYGSVLILLISTALIASRHLLMNPVR